MEEGRMESKDQVRALRLEGVEGEGAIYSFSSFIFWGSSLFEFLPSS